MSVNGETVELLDDAALAVSAPPLPVESAVVRIVRGYEALKAQCETMLLLLEHCPRDEQALADASNKAIEHVNAANAALWHLQHVRSCKGQS